MDAVTLPDEPRLTVLAPDDLGLELPGPATPFDVAFYDPGAPWPADHLDAAVVVVGYENAEQIGARFADLPGLRLVQPLNAGYEHYWAYVSHFVHSPRKPIG